MEIRNRLSPALAGLVQDIHEPSDRLVNHVRSAILDLNVQSLEYWLSRCTEDVLKALAADDRIRTCRAFNVVGAKQRQEEVWEVAYYYMPALLESRTEGLTPLMHAARADTVESANFLLGAGADPTATDENGWTALFWAVWSRSVEMVKSLLHALGLTATSPSDTLESRDHLGNTPLLIAAAEGSLDVVKELIRQGADVNAKNNSGRTALSYASERKYVDLVTVLLANGARTDERDNEGLTPLLHAIQAQSLEIIDALIDAGADPDLKDRNGRSARSYRSYDDFGYELGQLLSRARSQSSGFRSQTQAAD
ncbi:ankyrin repeat domain-containing protein [Bordetella sp. 15P40C-2]|uniref:ankyrin repeat domain-containing protein n=1 Tax=Bordetella sp. 15P40C-2 TaxID=2572246 RepID=UPI00132369BE|nr:ankyrin repeat domain-containing protein [Bordetella sp. 15P40C-2]MVW70905.1 hypothetical protein [Bordetella sp. 15P40C-2]